MNINACLLIVACCGYFFIGFLVWRANPRSRINVRFFIFTLTLGLWAYSVVFATFATTDFKALLYIRLAHVIGAFIASSFFLFTLSFPENKTVLSKRKIFLLQLIPLLIAAFSLTPYIVKNAELTQGAPLAEYGPCHPIYYIYWAAFVAIGLIILFRKFKRMRGIKRLQVGYIFYGTCISAVFSVLTNMIAPVFSLITLETYSPIYPIVIVICTAYAIAKYNLMDITVVIARTTVYALLTTSVTAGYIGTVLLSNWLFGGLMGLQTLIPAMIAALLIAFAFTPLKEFIQAFIDKTLFKKRYDHRVIIGDLSRILTSIFSLEELLPLILDVITEAMGIEKGTIYLPQGRGGVYTPMAQRVNGGTLEVMGTLRPDHQLIRELQRSKQIIVREQVERMPRSNKSLSVIKLLKEMELDVCVPIFSKEQLTGILFLGTKTTGEIFTIEDIDMFSTLSHHIAVAIENAQLYTKVEESRIYQEILLNSLTSGVIAVDLNERITAFNRKAEDILGISAAQALDQHSEPIPPELRDPLMATLKQGCSLNNEEITLKRNGGKDVPLAVSSSIFKSYDGNTIGALIVFFDLSERKLLEAEMRRTDRLASLGTLAAGMAHEIKNPLVSLKTFTQLMPEKYNDREFRERFSRLATQEVDRINQLVEQLLDFSRPVSSSFRPTALGKVLENTLLLLENKFVEKNIKVEKEMELRLPPVMADSEQLRQVFLNLIINALQSMDKGDMLRIVTTVRRALDSTRAKPGGYDKTRGFHRMRWRDCAVVEISDTGHGIDPKDLPHLFDPFFTTKESGVGLGLAIAHNIVEEHGGVIDVRSTQGKGSTFTITIPISTKKAGAKK